MGKAAIKQARTLELEFTLAPRPNDTKGRNGRRVGARPPDKQQDSNTSNATEPLPVRLPGVSFSAAADIGNPEEFPSLTIASGSVTKSRSNGTDSLAQKLAKNNRFTVKSKLGPEDHDDFPCLVGGATSVQTPDFLVLEEKKPNEKVIGHKQSVRLRVGAQDSVNDVVISGNFYLESKLNE